VATLSPDRSYLTFFVKAPDIFNLIRDDISEDPAGLCAHVQVAGGEDYLIRLKLFSIVKFDGMRENLGNTVSRFDGDFLLGN